MPNVYEVLIVGGGIIGLSLARALKKRGIEEIAVVEKDAFGQEASSAAAGMLSPQVDAERDDEMFRFCLESNRLYPTFVEELQEETGIDVELSTEGTFLVAFNEAELAKLKHRYEWQKKAGLEIELAEADEVRRQEPFISPDVRGGLFFPNDWQVENRKLVSALEKYARLNRINLISETEVSNVLVENGKIEVETANGEKLHANVCVLSAGAFTHFIRVNGAQIFTRVKPIRGQMIAFRTTQRFFRHVIYSQRGYIVPRKDGRVLVGATVEDVGFDKSVTDAGVKFLTEVGYEIAPAIANLKIAESWAGLRPFVEDGLPIIGNVLDSEKLFVATAHYRNGILLAPITAEILADKIVKNVESKYLQVFSLKRFL